MQNKAAADKEMQNEGLWTLIARKLAGEASQDEVNELEELQRENHHIDYYIAILSAWWKLVERKGKDEAEKAFNRLLEELENDERNSKPTAGTFLMEKETRGKSITSMKSSQQPYGKKILRISFLK